MGGADLPPLLYGYRRIFSIFFFNRGHVLDVKGQNPKAKPSTLKIVAHRVFFEKSTILAKILKNQKFAI